MVSRFRNWSWLAIELLFPVIGTAAMVYVYRALHAPAAYTGFVVLGGTLLSFWQNVLFDMAGNFVWERSTPNLELYAMSPTSLVAVLVGMALGGIFYTTLRASVVFTLASAVFGVVYRLGGVIPAVGVLLLTLAALYALGMLLASLFLFFGRGAWTILDGMQEPVYFMSGFYFPVHSLGAYLGSAASLIPLTLGLDAMRQLLIPGTPVFVAPAIEVLLLAVQLPLYLGGAQWSLRLSERLARRDARLSMRWT